MEEGNMISLKSEDAERSCRPAARISASLERSLSAYAYAAAAAGVGLLALAPATEAKIVYTPANLSIPMNGGPVLLDVNHDGSADFSFSNVATNTRSSSAWDILRAGATGQNNGIWGRGNLSRRGQKSVFASALDAGFMVGPKESYFQSRGPWLMALRIGRGYPFSVSSNYGQWSYTRHRYLGLKFIVSGQVHYGWARVAVTLDQNKEIVATLTGYAYETIPNKQIIAGKTKGPDVITWEPATLGRLAQGASGISAWREKK